METADVTAVIAAYNREHTIETAVRSVLQQTLGVVECVVVDDGSKDGTSDAVRSIPDPRVKLIRLESNAGISAARNVGIQASRTRWVAFQDSDDEWLPRKLELQMRKLDEEPSAVACYCGMLIVGEPGSEQDRSVIAYHPPLQKMSVSGDISVSILFDSLLSTQTIIARRDVLNALGGFDEALKALVDWDLAIRMAQVGPILLADEPAVIQRFSPNSVTHNRKRRVESWEHLFRKHDRLFRSEPKARARMLARIVGGAHEIGDREKVRRWTSYGLREGALSPSLLKHAVLSRIRSSGPNAG